MRVLVLVLRMLLRVLLLLTPWLLVLLVLPQVLLRVLLLLTP